MRHSDPSSLPLGLALPPGVLQDFETFFEPVFAMFAAQRRNGESLGDFTARVGFDAVRAFQASYIAPAVAEKLPKVSSSPPPRPACPGGSVLHPDQPGKLEEAVRCAPAACTGYGVHCPPPRTSPRALPSLSSHPTE